MGQTRTSGITSDADGNKIVNKQVDGESVYARLGTVSQEQAEAWLADKVQRIRLAKERGSRPRVAFREAALRYLTENRERLRSINDAAWHVELLDPWIGEKAIDQVYDETLQPFKLHRLKVDEVTLTTVNRSLELVRRILNLCARKFRHPNGMTWLETAPLISVDTKEAKLKARRAYPLSWEEQDMLFAELPAAPNRAMALFKVNTGTREDEVCKLKWSWEIAVPELKTSVFIIPAGHVKNEEDRLIVLNQVATSVINAQRGIHPEHVFVWKGKPVQCMNNTAWQKARKRSAARYAEKFGRPANWGFEHVRVHDIKHTFGRRLRAAGVGEETRKVLLGHKNGDITTHYSTAELGELINAVNRIDRSLATPAITLLRVAA